MRKLVAFVFIAAAAVLGFACGGSAPRTEVAHAPAHASRPAATSSPLAHAAAADPEPSSAPAGCASCHRKQSVEWSASLHRSAFTDADFQASYQVEPLRFCFDCHAPGATGPGDRANAAAGVGCTSCHEVGAGHGSDHVTARTTDCSSCHEFSFPGRPALMQSTVTEHRRSPFAGTSCASCHLPRAADGHRDHRFDVSRNEQLLQSALDVRSRRTAEGIEVHLTTRGVGHALPTGDLFRRLVVAVRGESVDGTPLGEEEVVLARRFDRRSGVPVEIEDTRIFGERRFRVDGDWLAAAARVEVEVRYERVAQTFDVVDVRGERQRRDAVFASVVLSRTLLSQALPER